MQVYPQECPGMCPSLTLFFRTLGEEEPTITTIALRPGVVETNVCAILVDITMVYSTNFQMQLLLRETGAVHLSPEVHDNFVNLHAHGKLLKPEYPGHVIASLALHAPKTLSGQFVSWDDDECKEFREE